MYVLLVKEGHTFFLCIYVILTKCKSNIFAIMFFHYLYGKKVKMDRVFKSKVGLWYHLILFLIGFYAVKSFIMGASAFVMVSSLLVFLECIHILLNTWYKITADGELIVHCSFFPEKKIAIEEITALEPTSTPVSSYALSLDILVVWKGEKPWLVISPSRKAEFVKVLQKINPEIEIME